jgi:Tol biopolymer transport system component
MKRSLFIAPALLFVLILSSPAQPADLKDTFLEAESYFLFEEYNEALPLYMRIHRADPGNDNINYKIGVCLLNDPYQKGKSISYLQQASNNINPKYRENSYKETQAPPEVIFYLGNAYLINNQLDKAEEKYNAFMEILDEKIYDRELVEEQIRICQRARKLQTLPVDYDRSNLGDVINSRFADINPVVSGNGQRIVYVSKMQFYDATFFSEKVDGKWQPPRNIIPELGVDGDVYPTCLSWSGNTMIIYRNDNFTGNLYMSQYMDGKWTEMEELDGINTKYWESHGSLTKDGNTLYFTSNRKGGYGGLDIYRSERLEDCSWGEPVNLGPVINSRYNEETPFITENGKKLYYSSYGHYNMGGYDIFYSQMNEEGEWGTPINLGYPINTPDDDLFFLPVNNGDNAFLAKYLEDGYGRHDIYYLDIYSENNPRLYMITGVIGTEGRNILEQDSVVIYLVDRDSRDTVFSSKPDLEKYTFTLRAPEGDYDLLFRSPSFNDLVQRIRIDGNTEKEGLKIEEPLQLEPVPYTPLVLRGRDSRIVIEDSVFSAVAGKPFRIRISLEKGSTLLATHLYGNDTIAADTFQYERKKRTYTLTPLEGKNIVALMMEEENGDLSYTDLVINAVKPGRKTASATDTAAEVIVSLLPLRDSTVFAGGDSLDTAAVKPPPPPPPTEAELILEKLIGYAHGELLNYLEDLEPSSVQIITGEQLMDHLTEKVDVEYAPEQLISALSDMVNDRSLESFINYLEANAPGKLSELIGRIDLEKEQINSIRELVSYLINNAAELGISQAELQRILIEMLADYSIAPILDVDPVVEGWRITDGALIGFGILGAAILFILFFFRRKKRKEEKRAG